MKKPMTKQERLSKMIRFISTFPDWAIMNLGYHMKTGTRVCCGTGFVAYHPPSAG